MTIIKDTDTINDILYGKPNIQEIIRYIHICNRCSHQWVSKQAHPRVCPKCKSPYWDKERRSR